ncbi:oligopeptide ABC transporter substrate-binding protein [Planococcus antarcticus DSM 14505]|uniref:Peptide ABC transporter substrate-binding protein n=1 Tax=Planococcus antarcticus DSM 14505 TaxID=1185653 RepID=A0A1C7DEG2_9BACL|nr:ABC transporter substrate-binding protein [Planococcus antarcticus]ANU09866.1 peptide ABC transporter substrate-binding protein [Planococcus antarcticus DSM 14505]EIM07524.1 oligopeptide ABC transporter substrate-binding protein [Planococcus antarcticus DSM 14505]
MKKLLWVLLLVLTLVIAGCSGGETSSTEGEEPVETSDSKTLTIAMGTDIVTFDIHDHNTTSTEAVHVNMFNYLLTNDPEEGFQPDLAESWENIDDTTWSFKLREGVTFHNGEELTADDVKYTLERVAKDDTLLEHGNYNQIETVNVVSDYEFEIVTKNPEPALLNRLSRLGSGILPQEYIETEGWEVFLENPVGTGPYKFKEWKRDDRLTLEANTEYFGDAPKWEELVFRSIPEDSTRVSELLTGGVDVAVNIPPTDVERVNETEGVTTVQSPTQRVMMLVLRTDEDSVTGDPLVREAIDLAIDKQAIVDSLLEGAGTVTRTRVTPGNVGANEDLYGQTLYDPERARELLAEAGYPDGFELTLTGPNGRYLKDRETVELIAAMLSEVGITVNQELIEWSAFNQRYQERDFAEMFYIGYGNSMFDASLALDRLTIENAEGETDYDNQQVNDLLLAAEQNMDPEERVQQYQEAQEIIAEDRPQIYMFQLDAITGINERLDFEPLLNEMFYADSITLN